MKISKLGLFLLPLSVGLVVPGSTNAGLRFEACATGAQEAPPPGIDTDGRAEVRVIFDPGLTKAKVSVRIHGVGSVTGAHFHCKGSGLNGPVAFGLLSPGTCALVAGKINCTLTNADWTGNDCVPQIGQPVNNIAALHAAMEAGLIYFNVHTSANPGGEVRGQVGAPVAASCLGNTEDEDED